MKTGTEVAARLFLVVEEFRKLHPKVSIQWLAAFLHVAAHPNCTPSNVAAALGVEKGAATMILNGLADSLFVVERLSDLEDRRFKRLRLSAKGKRLYRSMANLFARPEISN